MSKPVKEMIAAELRDRYAGFDSACVVDITGMDVHSTEKLRVALRERSARLEVIRNSMACRAFEGTVLEALGRSLEGPCGLVVAPESIIEAAKVLVETRKEFAALTLKQAMLEGDPNLLTVEELSKLKSHAEMIGEIAALIVSPARSVAGCIGSPQAKIAGCLKAIVDKAA